jgi:hypothetical protein
MKPIRFSEFVQKVRGYGMQVDDLPVLSTYYDALGPAMISCWRPSLKDLLRIIFTRKVYLVVLGRVHPAVSLSADPKEAGIPETEEYYEESG